MTDKVIVDVIETPRTRNRSGVFAFRTVEDACPYDNEVLLSIVERTICFLISLVSFFEKGCGGEIFLLRKLLPRIFYHSLLIAFKDSSSKYSRGSTARSEIVISKWR